MTTNTLELVLNWPRAPIPLAVDVLKSIYERAAGPQISTASIDGESAVGDKQPVPAEPPDLSHILTAVALLQSAVKGIAAPASSYDDVRRHFLDLQTQLRRQKLAIESLVGKTFDASGPTSAPIFQQTLHMRCPRGGRSGGRFRCVNRTEKLTTVTVAAEPLLGDVTGRLDGATLTVTPESCALHPEESRLFVVDVDFSPFAQAPDRQAGAALEIAMDGALTMKVWIAVEFDE